MVNWPLGTPVRAWLSVVMSQEGLSVPRSLQWPVVCAGPGTFPQGALPGTDISVAALSWTLVTAYLDFLTRIINTDAGRCYQSFMHGKGRTETKVVFKDPNYFFSEKQSWGKRRGESASYLFVCIISSVCVSVIVLCIINYRYKVCVCIFLQITIKSYNFFLREKWCWENFVFAKCPLSSHTPGWSTGAKRKDVWLRAGWCLLAAPLDLSPARGSPGIFY